MQKIRLADLILKGQYRLFRLVEDGPIYVLGYLDRHDSCHCWLRDASYRGSRCRVLPASKNVFEVVMAW